jgi:hypothetical protein
VQFAVLGKLEIEFLGAERRKNDIAAAVIRRERRECGEAEGKNRRHRKRWPNGRERIQINIVDSAADENKKQDKNAHQGGAAALVMHLTLSEIQSRRCVQRQPLR